MTEPLGPQGRLNEVEIGELAAKIGVAYKAKALATSVAAARPPPGAVGAAPPVPGGQMEQVADQRLPPDTVEKIPALDEASLKGHFGWDTIDQCHIPYIFRSGEKYVAVRMVENKLLNKYLNYLHKDIYSCTYIQSYYITKVEARLLNEINNRQCDGQFGAKPFTQKDLVVRLSDIFEFYNFLEVCYNKLHGTTNTEDKCGFILINKESMVPYTVRGRQKFVPLFYFDGEMDILKLKADQLKGWDLSYLKFCCKVHGTDIELFECETWSVISLTDIKSYFPAEMEYEEYWPNKVVDSQLLISAIDSVSASGQWARAPLEPRTRVHLAATQLHKPPPAVMQMPHAAGPSATAAQMPHAAGPTAAAADPTAAAVQMPRAAGLSAAATRLYESLLAKANLPDQLTQAETQQVQAQVRKCMKTRGRRASTPRHSPGSAAVQMPHAAGPTAPAVQALANGDLNDQLTQAQTQQVQDLNPPTTPELATPREGSPSLRAFRRPGAPRPRRRQPALSDDVIASYLDRDSGSELEDAEVDDDEVEEVDDNAQRLRDAALRLRRYADADVDEAGESAEAGEAEEAGEAAGLFMAGLGDGEVDVDVSGLSDKFTWTTNFSSHAATEEVYTRTPGPKYGIQTPVDLFLLLWDVAIVQKIVDETNYYAWQTIAAFSEVGNIPKHLDYWVETTVPEMYRYFAILMLMSLSNRGSIREFWTTDILEMPRFRALMSRNRYQLLSRFLHFVNNEYIPHDVRSYARKVAKVAPMLEHCNRKFQSLYTPEKQLSLDESLLLWKGRLSWIQCIRTKAARFGIKTFELCEASTGYMLRCIIYAGKNSSLHEGSLHGFTASTAKVVLKLMNGYLDVGHLLVMDNWYNQLLLTRYLKQRHTDIVGTLNRRREHVPDLIKYANESQMEVGQAVNCHSGDMTLTAWKDVKLVTVISTYHNDEFVAGTRAGQQRDKPLSVSVYNQYMGGVDLKDQKLSMYLLERKRGMKWYIKVFRRLLNTSILNAYIMYCKNPMFKVLSHREFRLKLAKDLCARFPRDTEPISRPQLARQEVRFDRTLQHFPERTPLLSGVRHSQRRCAQCASRNHRAQVTTMCSVCRVALCIGECWRDYHNPQSLT